MAKEIKPMRLAFGEALVRYGGENPDVVVLDADTSSSTQTIHFARAFPDRFFNVGVSEANLVSIAAGLSLAGKIPFAVGFAFLLAFRAGDQIRSQVAYGNLNVKLVGSYCGLSDSADGGSHQSVADLSVFRTLPNMTVVCCADLTEAELVVEAAIKHQGPLFIRVSRAECARIFAPETHPLKLGEGIELVSGDDISIIATGTMVGTCLNAAKQLSENGINPNVIEIHTLKPIDRDIIARAANRTKAIITCEEHTIYGGLFSAVCEVVAGTCPVPVLPIGIKDRFGETGKYPDLLKEFGLTEDDIVKAANSLLKQKGH